jgi:hypothetical protein
MLPELTFLLHLVAVAVESLLRLTLQVVIYGLTVLILKQTVLL